LLIDLHCHTLPRSTCSQLQPAELVEAARVAGLDAICLTEHDRWWPADELEELRERTGFLVLSGVELTTDLGHVLAFGLPESASGATATKLALSAERHGPVLYLAHPARDNLLRLSRRVIDSFASVEVANGSDSRLKNVAAAGIARGFRLPGIGGSDAHTLAEVGRAATRFEDAITDEAMLVQALLAGRYEAVTLES
jgi:predicted metal-dependent phosphoesterase TrpH